MKLRKKINQKRIQNKINNNQKNERQIKKINNRTYFKFSRPTSFLMRGEERENIEKEKKAH